MRLSERTLNALVDDLTGTLAGGSLSIYAGKAPPSPQSDLPPFTDALVTIALRTPAFFASLAGSAMGSPVEATIILMTGTASWARLSTSAGLPVADLVVTASDSPDVKNADIVVDRTDFHRGGLCAVNSMILRLPA